MHIRRSENLKINIQRKRKWPEIVQQLLEGVIGVQYENLKFILCIQYNEDPLSLPRSLFINNSNYNN